MKGILLLLYFPTAAMLLFVVKKSNNYYIFYGSYAVIQKQLHGLDALNDAKLLLFLVFKPLFLVFFL